MKPTDSFSEYVRVLVRQIASMDFSEFKLDSKEELKALVVWILCGCFAHVYAVPSFHFDRNLRQPTTSG